MSSSETVKITVKVKPGLYKHKYDNTIIEVVSEEMLGYHGSWLYMIIYKAENKEKKMSKIEFLENYVKYKPYNIADEIRERAKKVSDITEARTEKLRQQIQNRTLTEERTSNPPKQSYVPSSHASLADIPPISGQPKKGGSTSMGMKQMYNGRLRTVYIGSKGGRFIYADASKKKKVYV